MKARWFTLVFCCTVFSAPLSARAGCSVLSLEGQPLQVEELDAGSWEAALDASTQVFHKAKAAGELFDRVYGGSYKVQEVRADLERANTEWDEALAHAQQTALPFDGACAGELLADILRKAIKYREPEINMVNAVLGGKPLQASQKTVHDARSQDYREFERRFTAIVQGADVLPAFDTPPETVELPLESMNLPQEASPTH